MQKRLLVSAFPVMALIGTLFVINAGGASSATCVPASNIEAIIDDSGSMLGTDAANNRVEGLKILLSKTSNANKTMGAVEFGSDTFDGNGNAVPAAATVFAPQPIGPNAATMKTALEAAIIGDHGATNYNAAFDRAKTDNPNANARIFLTDGGHNEGDYLNGHQGGPPTYVVGLNVFGADDVARLQQIANETGGRYFPDVTTANLNATMNEIDAALNCQAIGNTYTDRFTKQGQVKSHSTKLSSSTRSADLVLSWENPVDAFTIGSIRLRTKSGTIASIARKRLKIKRTAGKTFVTVHIRGLKRGRLSFKLRAKTLSSFAPTGVQLTTQVTQSGSRR